MALHSIVLLSTLFSPQGPVAAPAPTPPPAASPAAWLPAGTTFAIVLTPAATGRFGKEQLEALQQQDPTGSVAMLLEQARDGLAEQGLGEADLLDLWRGGIAVGVHGATKHGDPAVTFAARLPTRAPDLRRALQKRGRQTRIDSLDCLEFTGGPFTLVGDVFGQHLLLTSDPNTLLRSVAATRGATGDTLATAPDFVAAATQAAARDDGALLFVRPARFARELADLPALATADVPRIASALDLDRIEHAMVAWTFDGDRMRVGASLHAPGARGVLAALLGDAARLDDRLAKVVPAGALRFALAAVDLGQVVAELLHAVEGISPGTGQEIRTAWSRWQQETGVDPFADLLGGCTGQIASIETADGAGFVLGVRNTERWLAAARALLSAAGDTPDAERILDVEVLRGSGALGTPLVVGTVGDWLCCAANDEVFRALALQIRGGELAPEVRAAREHAPAGTTQIAARQDAQRPVVLVRTADGAQLRDLDAEPAATAPVAAGTPDEDYVRALHALEKAGKKADPAQLATLVAADDATVARRAAWLLGNVDDAACLPHLHAAASSPDAEVRLLAMTGILRKASTASMECAVAGLDDADRRVRTAAAQLLGKLRRPGAKEPLLALLQRGGKATDPTTDTSDLQAALVALHDLGATDALLPAATTLAKGGAQGLGQALAFYWQGVSPKLPRDRETLLLLAVLDHRELLLRRYAIDRLTELDAKPAAAALEKRLGAEGPELRPLLESSLAYLRRDQVQPPSDELDRALANVQTLWHKVSGSWQALDRDRQLLYGGSVAGGFVVLLAGLMLVRRSRRRREQAQQAAAMAELVNPSDDYVEQTYADETGEEYGAEEELYEDAGAGRR